LGQIEVYQGSELIPHERWHSNIAKALFAYLVCYKTGLREKLMAIFWPDYEPIKSQNNLRTTVHYIRQALGAQDYIIYRDGRYAFVPLTPCIVDVDQFKHHLAEARKALDDVSAIRHYSTAVELYQGDYMEGFYYDWVLWEQEWLRYMYLDALEGLARISFRQEDYAQAIEHCRQLLQVDHCWEEAYRITINSWLKLGRRDQAIRYCRLVSKMLQQELGMNPTPETEDLIRFVLRGS